MKAKTKISDTTADVQPKKAQTLYEISKEYSALEELLEGVDSDISPEQQTQIDEFLSGLAEDRDAKIDGYCGLIRSLDDRQEARKREADRMAKLAKYDENKVKRLKWVLLNFMQLHDVERIETVKFRLRLSANASAPVVLGKRFEEFPEELPEQFRTVTFKPNLTAIKNALKEGEKLDFASLGEKGKNLKIE